MNMMGIMEEPGEQCTVVFALIVIATVIVNEPASECVSVGGGWGGI